MNRIISSVLASALIFGAFLPREEAVAQTTYDLKGLREEAQAYGILLDKDKALMQTANEQTVKDVEGLMQTANEQAMAKELVGTWTLVSVTLEQDGKKTDMYGANPQGQAIFDPNGGFSIMFIRSDVPKFASNNREAGTPEENKAAVRGSLAYFGTYSVSETDKVVTYHLQGSTFPNWRGTDQKRLFKLSGDELTFSNPTPSTGSGNAWSVWQRAKTAATTASAKKNGD